MKSISLNICTVLVLCAVAHSSELDPSSLSKIAKKMPNNSKNYINSESGKVLSLILSVTLFIKTLFAQWII